MAGVQVGAVDATPVARWVGEAGRNGVVNALRVKPLLRRAVFFRCKFPPRLRGIAGMASGACGFPVGIGRVGPEPRRRETLRTRAAARAVVPPARFISSRPRVVAAALHLPDHVSRRLPLPEMRQRASRAPRLSV